MSDYSPPQRDIAFVLDHVVPIEELTKLEPYQQIDADSVYGVLDEFGRLMADVWAPTNVVGDTTGSHIDGDEVVETLVAALEGRTGGAVVVRAAADAQADGETTLAEHVEGGHLLGQHPGRVQRADGDVDEHPDPFGERGCCRVGDDHLLVVEADALPARDARERPGVYALGPRDGGATGVVAGHGGQGDTDLHVDRRYRTPITPAL